MAISDNDRHRMQQTFNNDNMAIRYNQFIAYISDNPTGILDRTEYRVFQEMTLKKDVFGLAHALLNGVFTFDEYFDKIQMIVGWDLMIQGIFSGALKIKGNGEEHAINDDLANV